MSTGVRQATKLIEWAWQGKKKKQCKDNMVGTMMTAYAPQRGQLSHTSRKVLPYGNVDQTFNFFPPKS